MVSDNPESFADLNGHCGQGAPSEPCHDEIGHGSTTIEGEVGSSGIVNASCSRESCETAAEASAQQTQIAAQEAAKDHTLVLMPAPGAPSKTSETQQTESVVYTIVRMDGQGNTSKLKPEDGDHLISMDEQFVDKSKTATLCAAP
jgi:hypothetical protein